MSRLLWVLMVVGCAASEATPAQDVTVELASVTLGDECAGNPLPVPAKLKADAQDRKRAPSDSLVDGDCAGDCGYGCTQTSMQLALKSTGAAKPTTIKIKKVELLDDKGKLLEPLAAKQPSSWNGKKYEKWNEAINASQTLQVSYALSSPNWAKLTKGRRNAHTRVFQLRVTVTVGNKDRTVEKQAVATAMIEPDVDT